MKIFDSHCHYYGEKFTDTLTNYLNTHKNLTICQIGYDKKTNDLVMKQRKEFKKVYCAIGVHPNDAQVIDLEYIKELEANIDNCDALKSGLDYHWSKDHMEIQKKWFTAIIELCNKYNKPLVIHSRSAHEDTMKFIKTIKSKFVLHCYAYDLDSAKTAIKEGGYVSFTGVVTYKNAQKLKDIAKVIDSDKFMVETDCPYLTPVPYRGKTNFPHYVQEVINEIAKLRGATIDEIADLTFNNTIKFYGGKS